MPIVKNFCPGLLALSCLLLLLNSCHLDTKALTTVDTLDRSIPNIVIKHVTYKERENNKLSQEVYADEFRVFTRDNLVQVEKGRVKTYRNGKDQLEGSAEVAEYNQKTEDASVTGPIEMYYYPEKTRIRAQQLDWTKKERRLVSTPDSVVEVEQDNGTTFQGRNFSVDMSTKTVSYDKDVSGQLYAENQNPEQNQEQNQPATNPEPGEAEETAGGPGA